jgi:hypothetical protein
MVVFLFTVLCLISCVFHVPCVTRVPLRPVPCATHVPLCLVSRVCPCVRVPYQGADAISGMSDPLATGNGDTSTRCTASDACTASTTCTASAACTASGKSDARVVAKGFPHSGPTGTSKSSRWQS